MKRMIAFLLLFVACKSESQPTTVVIAPTASPSASQSATPGTLLGTVTSDDTCRADSECGWGEIDHDINSPKDCMCLLGCPSLPQNKATRDRRSEQNSRLCKPGMDGNGHHCPIDDCAAPPPIKCVSGKCAASRP